MGSPSCVMAKITHLCSQASSSGKKPGTVAGGFLGRRLGIIHLGYKSRAVDSTNSTNLLIAFGRPCFWALPSRVYGNKPPGPPGWDKPPRSKGRAMWWNMIEPTHPNQANQPTTPSTPTNWHSNHKTSMKHTERYKASSNIPQIHHKTIVTELIKRPLKKTFFSLNGLPFKHQVSPATQLWTSYCLRLWPGDPTIPHEARINIPQKKLWRMKIISLEMERWFAPV